MLKKLLKHRHRHKWSVVRTIWPYKLGWGTQCRVCKMIVDTGLTKEKAIIMAKDLTNSQRR